MDDVTLNKQAAGMPTEKEEAVVPIEVTPEAVAAAVTPPAPPTPEEQKKQMSQMRLMIFAAYADAARAKLAHNRGLLKKGKPTEKLITLGASKEAREAGYGIAFDENEQVKPEDLRHFVKLEGDDMVYAIDPKTKFARLALDKYGFISFPKQKGRLKKHISKKENTIKALALQVFPVFFAEHGGKLLLEAKAAAVKEGKEFDDTAFGIPEADMAALYKKAALTGTLMYNRNVKATRRQRRRQQQLSRHINAHQLPSGSVPSHTYFIFGVPGGAGKPCRAVVVRKAQEAADKAKEAAGASEAN
jgi:hypothetical protein